MPNLHYVLGDLEAASREQTNVDELLSTIAGFKRRTQERMTNSRQGAGASCEIFWLKSEARRLRERLDESNGHRHHLRTQHCSMRDTLAHINSAFSAPASVYYRMTNKSRRLPSTI